MRYAILIAFHTAISALGAPSDSSSLAPRAETIQVAQPLLLTAEQATEAVGIDIAVDAPQNLRTNFLLPDQVTALTLINAARAEKNLAPLSWNFTLQLGAYSWAAKLAEQTELSSSPPEERRGQGEVSASYSSTDLISDPYKKAVDIWLRGKDSYHGEVIPNGDFQSYGQYSAFAHIPS